MSNANLIAMVIGAVVSVVVGIAGLIVAYTERQRVHGMHRNVTHLNREVSELRSQLDKLLEEESKKKQNRIRRRHCNDQIKDLVKSNASEYSFRTADSIYSSGADSDEEFHDCDAYEDDNTTTILKKIFLRVDEMLNKGSIHDVEAVIDDLKELTSKHPHNAQVWCKLGKAYHILFEIDSTQNARKWIDKGVSACAKALELDTKSAEVHKWYAILVGSRSQLQTTTDQIKDAHLFKTHVKLSLELDPRDEDSHHLLGRFCYEIAGISWFQRVAAKTVFGELPNSTYQEALDHFMLAEQLSSYDGKENKLFIARCHIALKNHGKAVSWLQKAKKSKHKARKDSQINREISELLGKYNTN